MNIIEAFQKMESGHVLTVEFIRDGTGYIYLNGDFQRVGSVNLTDPEIIKVKDLTQHTINGIKFYILDREVKFSATFIITKTWQIIDYKKLKEF